MAPRDRPGAHPKRLGMTLYWLERKHTEVSGSRSLYIGRYMPAQVGRRPCVVCKRPPRNRKTRIATEFSKDAFSKRRRFWP